MGRPTSKLGLAHGGRAPFMWLVAALLTLIVVSGASAEREEAEEVDYMELAERLVADGHFGRATGALESVDRGAEDFDPGLYHLLRALVDLHGQAYGKARDQFHLAVKAGNKKPSVFLGLAQAHFGGKEWPQTLRALDLAGQSAEALAGAHITRAQCYWELKKPGKAISALNRGLERFGDNVDMLRMRVYYHVDLGLYQQALELGASFLERADASVDDYLALGEALRQAKQLKQAIAILELGRLRYDASPAMLAQLAHVYMEDGRTVTSAMLFEAAARRQPSYAYEAAELYLRAKRYERSLLINSRVPDAKVKLRQRLSIVIAQERWDMILGMRPALSRLGLLADDDIRYALAYGMFKAGNLTAASHQLKLIRSPELLQSVNALRRTIQGCSEKPWDCG